MQFTTINEPANDEPFYIVEGVGEKQITTDKKALWRILFNLEVDPSTINQENIYVVDENGNKMDTTLKLSNTDGRHIIVLPPHEGYSYEEVYKLIVKNVKSKKGKILDREGEMLFLIKDENSPL
ncbi:hypothetical protein BGM26_02935 [Bacillus sp. FJAT-29790]|uniref:hypothetical protein n=1 Tax=Bacillus sp. FJAT-29790 TaxID=1895002 RepID=UPI001C241CCD|nr:hypothetical protein [Bacillus sp. FJAT-29790]MBU8877948.1 hypothetical protein [Bacillus sp. FJAT-29790]